MRMQFAVASLSIGVILGTADQYGLLAPVVRNGMPWLSPELVNPDILAFVKDLSDMSGMFGGVFGGLVEGMLKMGIQGQKAKLQDFIDSMKEGVTQSKQGLGLRNASTGNNTAAEVIGTWLAILKKAALDSDSVVEDVERVIGGMPDGQRNDLLNSLQPLISKGLQVRPR